MAKILFNPHKFSYASAKNNFINAIKIFGKGYPCNFLNKRNFDTIKTKLMLI